MLIEPDAGAALCPFIEAFVLFLALLILALMILGLLILSLLILPLLILPLSVLTRLLPVLTAERAQVCVFFLVRAFSGFCFTSDRGGKDVAGEAIRFCLPGRVALAVLVENLAVTLDGVTLR
ncbi:hypothetical protein [Endozoicomonas sp. SESOKO1]|uniref:hypothetical protein n=1 Tax=Endozoicomonas sp. SESOKO1 TaxID=2828742 RepID=UPI002147F286|nr:hypothetical protein [Endozoicomonas sp. SESOKO1]